MNEALHPIKSTGLFNLLMMRLFARIFLPVTQTTLFPASINFLKNLTDLLEINLLVLLGLVEISEKVLILLLMPYL